MDLESRPRRFASITLLVIALATFVGLAWVDIDSPWEGGFRGANGGFYHGNFIKHWMKFGLDYTRGGCVLKSVPVDPPRLIYDFHHAPTYPLLVLPTVAALGLRESSIRLGALILAVPAILLLWFLGRRLAGSLVGGFAALLYATSAMSGYFGPMVDADNAVITFSLATVLAFLREVESPTVARRTVTFVLVFATALMDWPGYWTGPTLAVIALVSPNPRAGFLRVLRLAPAAVLAFVVFGLHTGMILDHESPDSNLVTAFVAEMLSLTKVLRLDVPTWGATFDAIVTFSWRWFQPALLVTAALAFLPKLLPMSFSPARRVAAALLLPGLIHAVMFRRNLIVHDFWIIHALPGLALLGALALEGLLARKVLGRLLAALLIAWAACIGVGKSLDEIAAHRTLTHSYNTSYIKELARPGDVIATSEAFDVESYYIDNFIYPHIATPAAFAESYKAFQTNRWAGNRLLFFVENSRRDSALVAAVSQLRPPIEHHHFLVWIFND